MSSNIADDSLLTDDDWTKQELEAAVSSYFEMLKLELSNRQFVKADFRRALLPKLRGRSKGSVEKRHSNISAVLVESGHPYIDGYKPLYNYPIALIEIVERKVRDVDLLQTLSSPAPTPSPHTRTSHSSIFEDPPAPKRRPKRTIEQSLSIKATKLDYARRENENTALGTAGEKFVLELEIERLRLAGREDLALRVEWSAQVKGDGLGYDIHSFTASGADLFIEVKTTKLGKHFPFYITEKELRFSRTHSKDYAMYRVFDFPKNPRVFVLEGDLSGKCKITATLFQAEVT